MPVQVFAVTLPTLAPFSMPDRFRLDVAHFMSLSDQPGIPKLPPGEYWVRLEDARNWYADGFITSISPLDSAHPAEIELTEDHEEWLAWMIKHEVQHIRLK